MRDSVVSWPLFRPDEIRKPVKYTDTDSLDPRSHRGESASRRRRLTPATHLLSTATSAPYTASKSQDAAAAAPTSYVAASPPPLPPRRRVSFPSTPHSLLLLAPPATIRPSPLNPRPFPLERGHGGAGIPRHVEGGLRGAGRAHGGHAGVHLGHRRLAVPPRAAYAVSTAHVLACGLVGSYCDFVEMGIGEGCGLWNLSVR